MAASATLTAAGHGNVASGATKDVTAVLTNTGIAAITLTKPTTASVTGTGFSFVSTTCGTSLNASATCNIVVRFTASGAASRTGAVSVATEAGTKTSTLSATSQAAILVIDKASVAIGDVQVGTSKVGAVFTLTNTGNITATTTTRSLSGTGMSISATTCGTSLAAAASCTITPRFAPTVTGAVTGTLTVSAANASNDTATVTGNGTAASFTASQFSGTTSPAQGVSGTAMWYGVTLTNRTGQSLTVTAVTGGTGSTGSWADGATLVVSGPVAPNSATHFTAVVTLSNGQKVNYHSGTGSLTVN